MNQTTKGPEKVFLYPTMRCNLHCPFCYSRAPERQHETDRELGTDEYQRLIEELIRVGVTIFDTSGGEPFLRNDFPAICRMIKSFPGTKLWVTTNGTLLARQYGELISVLPFLDKIYVSIDAANPILHDRSRGRTGAYAAMTAGIQHLMELIPERVGLNFILKNTNKHELKEILSFSARKGIPELMVLFPRDVNFHDFRHEYPVSDEYNVLITEVARFLASTEHLCVRMMIPARLFPVVGQVNQRYPEVINSRLFFEMDPIRGCPAYRDFLAVTADGDVFGCPFMQNISRFKLGNIRETPLSELLKQREPFRREFTERKRILHEISPCQDCPSFPVCQGGCPAITYKYYGTVFQPDPSCDKCKGEHEIF